MGDAVLVDVVRAHHAGRLALSEATTHLRSLRREMTLHVTSSIVDMALEQLHRASELA